MDYQQSKDHSEDGTTIRLFFAAQLGADARKALEPMIGTWRQSLAFASWLHPADWHVTVKFIGDVRPSLAEELLPPVRETVRTMSPFELSLSELGVFGRPTAPNILWCGVGGSGLDELAALHAKTEAAAALSGVEKEMRAYRPHITLARRYRGAVPFSGELLAGAQRALDAAWRVDHLVLYRTHFGRRPAYEALAKLPLEG